MLALGRCVLGRTRTCKHIFIFMYFFRSEMTSVLIYIAKGPHRTGLGSHVPSETSRHRPPTALKLGIEDSSLSGGYNKFGCDPFPVRRGLLAAVTCCERKTRFYSCLDTYCGREQEKPEPCVGFNTTKGKTCFIFCFTIPSLSALAVNAVKLSRRLP